MKILLAVEDKVFGEHIAAFVLAHEWSENVEFKVLHTVEPFNVGYYCDPAIDEKRWEWSKKLVGMVSQTLKDGFPAAMIEEVVVSGSAKEEILRIAKDWECDLIVVGSHGRHGLTQFLLGSVSMAVLSHASCSVMVVKVPSGKVQSAVKDANDMAVHSN